MKCGQILLVDYPFTDRSSSKVRPALVVSSDVFNERGDFVIVPISAKADLNDTHAFPLESTEPWFREMKLRPASRFVRWSKLMTVSRSIVHRRLGQMPAEQLTEIRQAIRRMFQ